MGLSSGFGDEWLRIGSLKMAIDGGLTSKTSLRTWNYVGDDTIEDFPLRLDLEKLPGWVKEAHDNDWGVGIHEMGDTAVRKAAEAIHAAWQANHGDRRHQLIHCYYADEEVLKSREQYGSNEIPDSDPTTFWAEFKETFKDTPPMAMGISP